MIPVFLVVFLACLLFNYIQDGGTFVFFSRAVEALNSLRERTPRNVRVTNKTIMHELKFGNRLYAVLIPRKEPMNWIQAGALIDGDWRDITKQLEYFAGPFRNFYEIPITPVHIDSSFQKLGFKMRNGEIVIVEGNEMIPKRLRLAGKSGRGWVEGKERKKETIPEKPQKPLKPKKPSQTQLIEEPKTDAKKLKVSETSETNSQ